MSSGDILLKIGSHYCKSSLGDGGVGTEKFRIPQFSFYGTLFQVVVVVVCHDQVRLQVSQGFRCRDS